MPHLRACRLTRERHLHPASEHLPQGTAPRNPCVRRPTLNPSSALPAGAARDVRVLSVAGVGCLLAVLRRGLPDPLPYEHRTLRDQPLRSDRRDPAVQLDALPYNRTATGQVLEGSLGVWRGPHIPSLCPSADGFGCSARHVCQRHWGSGCPCGGVPRAVPALACALTSPRIGADGDVSRHQADCPSVLHRPPCGPWGHTHHAGSVLGPCVRPLRTALAPPGFDGVY